MSPSRLLIDWLDRRFDPICPTAGWYLRRVWMTQGLRGITLLFLVAIFLVTVGSIVLEYPVGETIDSLAWTTWIFVLIAAGLTGNTLNLREITKSDELFRLDGLTDAQRSRGDILVVLAGLALPCCYLLPTFFLLICLGASWAKLVLSLLLPLAFAVDVILGMFPFTWFRPKLHRFTQKRIRWYFEVFFWDLVHAGTLLWLFTCVLLLFFAYDHTYPGGAFAERGWYFFLVLVLAGVAEFFLCQVMITWNHNHPWPALGLTVCCLFLLSLLIFPGAWALGHLLL